MLLSRVDFPTGGRAGIAHGGWVNNPQPAVGVVYVVEAELPPKPVLLHDFRLAFQGEIESMGSKPLAPPGGMPGPGEEIPFSSENGMRQLIQSAICEKLPTESLDALAYLVRRAHGVGYLAGKNPQRK